MAAQARFRGEDVQGLEVLEGRQQRPDGQAVGMERDDQGCDLLQTAGRHRFVKGLERFRQESERVASVVESPTFRVRLAAGQQNGDARWAELASGSGSDCRTMSSSVVVVGERPTRAWLALALEPAVVVVVVEAAISDDDGDVWRLGDDEGQDLDANFGR